MLLFACCFVLLFQIVICIRLACKLILYIFCFDNQILPSGEVLHRGIAEPPPVVERYFGHETSLQVPDKLCLMGCVFTLVGFESGLCKLDAKKRAILERGIRNHGAEIDSCYSPRTTHILCDSQKHDIVTQAVKEGKRIVTAYWANDVMYTGGKMRPPWLAWHLPMAGVYSTKPLSEHVRLTWSTFIEI